MVQKKEKRNLFPNRKWTAIDVGSKNYHMHGNAPKRKKKVNNLFPKCTSVIINDKLQ